MEDPSSVFGRVQVLLVFLAVRESQCGAVDAGVICLLLFLTSSVAWNMGRGSVFRNIVLVLCVVGSLVSLMYMLSSVASHFPPPEEELEAGGYD